MRVVSGKFGGRRFDAKVPANVRPTSDRVRESIFDVLLNLMDFEGKTVLDLFAGTGMLGIESLSRGAGQVTFVDSGRNSINYIKSSVEKLNAPKNEYEIVYADALKYLERNTRQFDLIFMDPPYSSGIYNEVFSAIVRCKTLGTGGILVSESGKSTGTNIPEGLHLISFKNFGDTIVDFLESTD